MKQLMRSLTSLNTGWDLTVEADDGACDFVWDDVLVVVVFRREEQEGGTAKTLSAPFELFSSLMKELLEEFVPPFCVDSWRREYALLFVLLGTLSLELLSFDCLVLFLLPFCTAAAAFALARPLSVPSLFSATLE